MRFGMRELLFVLLLVAMPVVAYFYHFQRSAAEREAAIAELLRKQDKLAQLERETANIANLDAEIAKLQEVIATAEQRLPARREEQVILREVDKLAQLHRLRVKSVRTDKIVTGTAYTELPIRMTIFGDFDGFYSFLLDLEKLPRISRLPKMELEKQATEKQDAGEGQMQADIVLSIFFEGAAAS